MKTLAIRLEEDQHALMSALAQLSGRTITDEIREAIETHIAAKRANPELTARAKDVVEEIERQAHVRQTAIATLFGTTAQPEPTKTDGHKQPAANPAQK